MLPLSTALVVVWQGALKVILLLQAVLYPKQFIQIKDCPV